LLKIAFWEINLVNFLLLFIVGIEIDSMGSNQ